MHVYCYMAQYPPNWSITSSLVYTFTPALPRDRIHACGTRGAGREGASGAGACAHMHAAGELRGGPDAGRKRRAEEEQKGHVHGGRAGGASRRASNKQLTSNHSGMCTAGGPGEQSSSHHAGSAPPTSKPEEWDCAFFSWRTEIWSLRLTFSISPRRTRSRKEPPAKLHHKGGWWWLEGRRGGGRREGWQRHRRCRARWQGPAHAGRRREKRRALHRASGRWAGAAPGLSGTRQHVSIHRHQPTHLSMNSSSTLRTTVPVVSYSCRLVASLSTSYACEGSRQASKQEGRGGG